MRVWQHSLFDIKSDMQEDVVLPEPCHFGVIGGHTKDLIKESTVLFKRVQNGRASSAFCPSSDFSFHCCGQCVRASLPGFTCCWQRPSHTGPDPWAFCSRAVRDIIGLAAGMLMLLAGQEPRHETSRSAFRGTIRGGIAWASQKAPMESVSWGPRVSSILLLYPGSLLSCFILLALW